MLTINQPYPWQKSQWQIVTEQLQKNTLPPVLLLLGIRGLGKKHFATILGNALLCEQRTSQNLSCQQCASCQLLEAGTHPDYYPIFKNEDERVIRIETIRELKTSLSQTSFKGKGSVVIIDAAESLHTAAANALLKILEEPPSYVSFILCANSLDLLPPTLVSRCYVIRFTPLFSTEALENTKATASFSAISWRMSGGAPLLAQKYEDPSRQQWLHQFIESMLLVAQQQKSPIDWAAQWAKEDFSLLLEALLFYFSDQLKVAHGLHSDFLHWPQYAEKLKTALPENFLNLYKIWDLLIEAKRNEKIALNVQYLLEHIRFLSC